jgi:trehalose/maltose transport system substrate-binding protein
VINFVVAGFVLRNSILGVCLSLKPCCHCSHLLGRPATPPLCAIGPTLGADPKSAVSGKFDVSILPKGGENGNNAACLGGCQLMVSAYSEVPDAAAELVQYLSSAEVQKRIALHFSVLPTRPALYSDPEVLAKNPFFKTMLNVFNNAVARPSTVTGAGNQLSTAIFQNVSEVLSGTESGKDAVVKIEAVAMRIVH